MYLWIILSIVLGHSITPTDKGHNIPPTVPWQNFTFDRMSEPDLLHGSTLPPALFFTSSMHTFILALNVPFSAPFEYSALPFFPPKQMSVCSRRFILFCRVPASHKIIHLSDNMGSRQEVAGGFDSASNYPTSS